MQKSKLRLALPFTTGFFRLLVSPAILVLSNVEGYGMVIFLAERGGRGFCSYLACRLPSGMAKSITAGSPLSFTLSPGIGLSRCA
jgi:hypothetical protein